MYFRTRTGEMPMPTYTYRCNECKKRFERFMNYEEYGKTTVTCPFCQSAKVLRRIDRIRIAKSAKSNLDEFTDPSQLEGLEDDPKALGRLMRQMGEEMGEDVGPEFDEVVTRLEKGQDPEQISREMPELGEDDGGTDDLDF